MSKQSVNPEDGADKTVAKSKRHRPNILFIMVDQQRYPVVYDNDEIREWRIKIL